MEQVHSPSAPRPHSPAAQIQQQQLAFALRKKQIQNADKHSLAASISENLDRGGGKERQSGSAGSAEDEGLKAVVWKGWACVVGTAIQFSTLIGLILIQYISSGLALLPLFVLLLLTLVLHPPFFVLLSQACDLLQPCSRCPRQPAEHGEGRKESNKEDSPIPTLPKINQESCMRANAKTKKMQYANMEAQGEKNTQLTIKKEPDGEQPVAQQPQVQQQLHQAFAIRKTLLIILKVAQAILGVAVASLCLFSLADTRQEFRQAAIAISISTYFLAAISSFLFTLLFKEAASYLQCKPQISPIEPHHPHEKLAAPCEQPKTKVSIDQLMHPHPIIERKKTFSIDIGLGVLVKPAEEELSQSEHHEMRQSRSEKEAAIKLEIKRSVLKPSKVYENKPRKPEKSVAEEMERRKVEINSKKIQYFEYCEISPSQSMAEEDASRCRSAATGKLNAQRLKYIRQRMQAEARILSSKVMARQASTHSQADTKSQGCLSTPARHAPPEEEEDTRVDHFL